jgi:hypothetical protein
MSTEEKKAVVRRLLDVWETGNVDLIDELLPPDYVNHSPASPEQPTGPEGLREPLVCSEEPSPISDGRRGHNC